KMLSDCNIAVRSNIVVSGGRLMPPPKKKKTAAHVSPSAVARAESAPEQLVQLNGLASTPLFVVTVGGLVWAQHELRLWDLQEGPLVFGQGLNIDGTPDYHELAQFRHLHNKRVTARVDVANFVQTQTSYALRIEVTQDGVV